MRLILRSSSPNRHKGKTTTGKRLLPQTIANVPWRHYLHPEENDVPPSDVPIPVCKSPVLTRPVFLYQSKLKLLGV